MELFWKGKAYSNLVQKDINNNCKWLNLPTKKYKMFPSSENEYSLKNIMILGNENDIKEFWNENIAYFKSCNICNYLYIPYNDINVMVKLKSCQLTKPLKAPDLDIENIDIDTLNKICDLTLDGLFLKAKLADVIDGDTIRVWTVVSTKDISTCGRSGNSSAYITNGKMIIKIKCRLYGIDTAELKTDEGKESKEVLMKRLPKVFYIKILETDKYGRYLTVIYLDENGENLFKPDGNAYYGGKKK